MTPQEAQRKKRHGLLREDTTEEFHFWMPWVSRAWAQSRFCQSITLPRVWSLCLASVTPVPEPQSPGLQSNSILSRQYFFFLSFGFKGENKVSPLEVRHLLGELLMPQTDKRQHGGCWGEFGHTPQSRGCFLGFRGKERGVMGSMSSTW